MNPDSVHPPEIRAQQILDFEKIREMIASYSLTDLGKSYLLSLTPSPSKYQIQHVFDLTAELSLFLDNNKTPTPVLYDIRLFYKHIKIDNSTLGALELFQIWTTLDQALKLRNLILEHKNEYPLLSEFLGDMLPIHPLMTTLSRTFTDNGSISDNASDTLSQIRKRTKEATKRLKTVLLGLSSSTPLSSALDDREPVNYENRMVFRIKASYKNKIRGIIHGSSSSGQTYYFEPDDLVPENNKLIELHEEEEMEIYRILHTLTTETRHSLDKIETVISKAERLDHLFANVLFSNSQKATIPLFSQDHSINIRNGRHPFVKNCIPMTIKVELPKRILVISGPNTGGKTVALKIAGLFTLMAKTGFPILAEPESTIPFCDHVFVDLGDEQSIENDLSTFSAHVVNMKKIIENATSESLVIMDEPGVGTEPEFGETLAEVFLNELRNRNILSLVTTHYKRIKLLALDDPAFQNACVDYDAQTLTPLYRILYDVPGDSNPLMIMNRIAFPSDLLEKIHSLYGTQALDLAETVRKLSAEKQRLEQEALAAARKKEEYERLATTTQMKNEEVRRKEQTLKQTYFKSVKEFLHDSRSRFEAIVRQMQESGVDKQKIKQGQTLFKEIESFAETLGKTVEQNEVSTTQPIRVGDKVRARNQHYEGEVVQLKGDEAILLSGIIRTTVKISELVVVKEKNDEIRPAGYMITQKSPVKYELDLRGMYQLDALGVLEEYYDNLLLARLPSVRIIHGRGTGRLREMVREFFKKKLDKREIHSFSSPKPEQGGDGVTIVEL